MQDFADSQQMTGEIERLLLTHVSQDLNEIIWAIKGDEAGLAESYIDDCIDHNSPLYSTHVIFLERGNILAGLHHIHADHKDVFENLERIAGEEKISEFIKDTMKGKLQVQLSLSRSGGIKVLYSTSNSNFLRVVTADNGSITTAYPLSSRDIEWQLTIHQTMIKEEEIISKLDATAPLRTTRTIYLEEGNSKDGGLKSMYASSYDLFKRFFRLDSKEDVSKFIKTTMEKIRPINVLQGNFGGINVLYSVEFTYTLVMISKQGAITELFVTPYREGDRSIWSTLIDFTKITEEHIGSFGNPNPWLRHSHIIYTDKGDMTEIYDKNFQGNRYINDEKMLSTFIKYTITKAFPVAVNSLSEEPNLIDVVYKYNDRYLHVLIDSTGHITDAYIKPEP